MTTIATASTDSPTPSPGHSGGDLPLQVVELDREAELFAPIEAVRKELSLLSPARLIDCRRSIHGAWAGGLSLLEELVPRIDEAMPALLERHRDTLASISPTLRLRFPHQHLPLTESGPVKERVRSYPVDRAYRLAHGLVDLVLAWQRRDGAEPLELLCWGFDDADAMTERFLRELDRRSRATSGGAPIRLRLVVGPGGGRLTADGFADAEVHDQPLSLESTWTSPGLESLRAEAARLEELLDENPVELERQAARLIGLLEHLGEPERTARWRVLLLAVLNHYGWYEDALYFAQPLIARLDAMSVREVGFSRWHIVSGLFNALAALGRAEEAHVLVRDEAMEKVDDPTDLVSVYYTMAMLHVRFLPEKDLELGERYLEKSMEMVERCSLSEAEKHYLMVFNLNGLAFIRHLQGSPPAAIELCEDGYQHLEEHLASSEYRLHRSVLLYNLAQVFASIDQLEKAHEHYTGAMAIDPNYSEYYNERAAVLLRMGRLEESLVDLERAIELSPPYPEVWINLGQTLNLLERHAEAVGAYSRALDLDPMQVLPWLGRAQAHEALGEAARAASDYRQALALDPDQPLVWANLAALEYEGGRLEAALDAIVEAVRRKPDMADLYQNRAVVLRDLGRLEAVAADLQQYLELAPDAEDAEEVRLQLEELTASV